MNKFSSRTTSSGRFIIYHRDKCPFKDVAKCKGIPADHTDGPNIRGPWFFIPKEGCKTNIGWLRGYPLAYSFGYASPEEALEDAEKWEKRKPPHVAKFLFEGEDQ